MKPHIHFKHGMYWWTLSGTLISFKTIPHIIAWQRICRPRIEFPLVSLWERMNHEQIKRIIK